MVGGSVQKLNNESGQAITEYILLLGIIVTLAVGVIAAIQGAVDRSILKFGSRLEHTLKTGRLKPNVWEN